MNKVLESWHNNGVKTLSAVEKANAAKSTAASASSQRKGQTATKRTASYDLDEFNRKALHDPIVYKKKNKD